MNITTQDVLAAIPDIVQIAILYFAFYAILKAARGSRFAPSMRRPWQPS